MNRSIKWMAILAASALFSGSAAADRLGCDRSFMHDPCKADGYSVVESEKNERARHNCMAIAHYFPGEEPEGYCGGGVKGKQVARAHTPVAAVGY